MNDRLRNQAWIIPASIFTLKRHNMDAQKSNTGLFSRPTNTECSVSMVISVLTRETQNNI